ncbi:c-type cytochrome biogenesis protein CcsB [Asanoa ishikariensis]|uniref:Cytochrome c-type biogenesis protein CcsB n=1 Tax=Asanoa ishikariensis TaxID=137265 RepID=A0A1H3LBB5_9ACTN|nr:c-type cytochrome biogenesis protein CcsB [Asanoa ishikariensis]GIF65350.1 c-type cytochrome biogenesis protein CcsB [Asanoa ishikariensis]SDY61208.1 cytochrome c-type biogenesis protein CcsB [Asanoa ishikariensis]
MAALSDTLLVVAMLSYLVAMICYAAVYAFGDRGAVAKVATRELVGAGGPPVVEVVSEERKPSPGRPSWASRLAGAVLVLAATAQIGSLIFRGVAGHRLPWGNMYEYVLAATSVAAVAWIIVMFQRPALRHLGLYVALTQVVLLGVAGLLLYVPVGPLVPALDSYWLAIHVTAVAISSGVFLIGFVPAGLFLIRSGYDKGRHSFPFSLGERLPAAGVLERLSFRLHAFAFPIWTFGALIAGPIWAESAWGRYWGWDPKEVWAFISWVVYAGYLHARATPSVKQTTATWIAVLGFLTMLMNLFGVNIFFTGLHSYGGL